MGRKGIALKKSADSEESSSHVSDDSTNMESSDVEENGSPKYHQANPGPMPEAVKQKERDFRKKLNQAAREVVSDSIHKRVKLIVHRPRLYRKLCRY